MAAQDCGATHLPPKAYLVQDDDKVGPIRLQEALLSTEASRNALFDKVAVDADFTGKQHARVVLRLQQAWNPASLVDVQGDGNGVHVRALLEPSGVINDRMPVGVIPHVGEQRTGAECLIALRREGTGGLSSASLDLRDLRSVAVDVLGKVGCCESRPIPASAKHTSEAFGRSVSLT